ncbi:hypothetical protein [Glaciimonas sp. PCH181]|nr:hypothetical protein [Glaciimonas sp. PCH181]
MKARFWGVIATLLIVAAVAGSYAQYRCAALGGVNIYATKDRPD